MIVTKSAIIKTCHDKNANKKYFKICHSHNAKQTILFTIFCHILPFITVTADQQGLLFFSHLLYLSQMFRLV